MLVHICDRYSFIETRFNSSNVFKFLINGSRVENDIDSKYLYTKTRSVTDKIIMDFVLAIMAKKLLQRFYTKAKIHKT